MQHDMDTVDTVPLHQWPRCMPLGRQEVGNDECAGITEPSENPWASPVVMVSKRGGLGVVVLLETNSEGTGRHSKAAVSGVFGQLNGTWELITFSYQRN